MRSAIVATAIWALVPSASVADNLADALVGAYEHSGILEQNRAVLRAADENVPNAVAQLRPVIDYTVSMTRRLSDSFFSGANLVRNSTTASLSLNLQWLLWDNGQTKFTVQGAKENVLATRARLLRIEQQILQRAVEAYMTVLSANETVALREANVRLLIQELRAAQDRFDVGEVTRTDVALAESRLAEARSNVSTAQGNLIVAQQEYLVAVGRKPGRLAPPPRLPKRPKSVDAAVAVAMRQHPAIVEAQHQVAATELQVMATRAGLGPRVSLNGNVTAAESRNNQSESDVTEFGLNLQQRLYQGGALASGVRRDMANRDAARANLLETQRNVRQEVAGAMVSFEVAQANIRATDQRIRFAQIAFDGVREEATLGARTTLDVLDAEQELLDARTARITAEAQLQIAAYRILAAQGALTAANLRLGVPIYDPTEYYNQVKDGPALLSKQGQQLDKVLRKLGKD